MYANILWRYSLRTSCHPHTLLATGCTFVRLHISLKHVTRSQSNPAPHNPPLTQIMMEVTYKQQRELVEKETGEQQERAGMLQRGEAGAPGGWGTGVPASANAPVCAPLASSLQPTRKTAARCCRGGPKHPANTHPLGLDPCPCPCAAPPQP